MKNYSRLLRSKPLLVVTCILLVSVMSLLTINLILHKNKDTIQKSLSLIFNKELSFEEIKYRPFDFFILEGVTLKEKDGLSVFGRAKGVKLGFSLKELFLHRKINIREISLIEAQFDLSEFVYLNLSLENILVALHEAIKDKELLLQLKNNMFVIYKGKHAQTAVFIDGECGFNRQETLFSSCVISLATGSPSDTYHELLQLREDPLFFKFEGLMHDVTLWVDNWEISSEDFYLKLWGKARENTLATNGYLSIARHLEATKKPLKERIKHAIPFLKKQRFQIIGFSESNTNIYDLDFIMKLTPGLLSFERFNFTLNHIPFDLKGHFSFAGKPGINFTLSTYLQYAKQAWARNPKKFDFHVSGIFNKNKFSGKTSLDFLRTTRTKRRQQTIEITFKDLFILPYKRNIVKLLFDRADFYYNTGDTTYEIPFTKGEVVSNVEDKYFKPYTFTSGMYDGAFYGSGVIDMHELPLKIFTDMNIEGISANDLDSVLVYFKKVYGTFGGKMKFKNHPSSNLRGTFTIDNGYLDNLMFFSWLSNFFGIEALKKLDFESVTCNFIANDEVSALEDIKLNASGVAVSGYFRLFENDLVNSKLSIVLLRDVLETSPKFKSLARLLGKDVEDVDFDFQLSGLFSSMNFKWLDTDFKTKLKKAIPNFIERGIERKVEETVKSITSGEEIF